MPTPESAALADLFKSTTALVAANPDMDLALRRALFENLHTTATEPTGVTYETVTAAGLHAIWCHPVDGAKDRAILYTHGGGFVTNSPSSHRKLAGHLAKQAGASALVIDYRLAPEHLFPAAVEDAASAYKWLLQQGYKPGNIATAGDSAGGNLAVSVVLKLRELGEPLPGAIVGFSPWLDLANTGKTMETNQKTDVLVQREIVGLMTQLYLGDGSPDNPLANPLKADLKGLPPVWMTCGTAETLQDHAERFVALAKEAGVDATVEPVEGMQHVHVFMAGSAKEADDSIASAGKFLKSKLGK